MATGHVRKRGSRWVYVHYVIDPATGQGRYKWKSGFKTKSDAQRSLRKAMTAVEAGTFIEPTKISFADYINVVWLPQLTDQVESSTRESYERNMRVHVLPRLGGVRLQQLSPLHLNELYRDLQEQPAALPTGANRRHDPKVYARIARLESQALSYREITAAIREEFPSETKLTKDAVARIIARSREPGRGAGRTLSVRTVRYIHTIISRALKDAIKVGFIGSNAARNASPPRKPKGKAKKTVWTAEQTRSFLDWAKSIDHRLWPTWAFAAASGDRRGANLGLRWRDLDFDRGTAELISTVTCVNHQIVVKPYGKTGQNHAIVLDGGTLAMLRWWRARQNAERLMLGISHACASTDADCNETGYHLRDLVFSRPDGDYLHPERFSREFKRAQARYNREHPDVPLPEISLHSLRHGWATLALEAGVPMKVVQDRLNHATEAITADVYTHVRAPLQSDAAERVAAMILPELGEPEIAEAGLPPSDS